jgi:hypothetical protein
MPRSRLWFAPASRAEEFEKMEPDAAQRYAEHLTEKFVKETKELQVKFDVDPAKAAGLHAGKDGILMVPIKTLKEGEIDPAVETENGGGICYLDCSQCFHPLVEGKPADSANLRKVKIMDGEGNEQEAACFLVTAKHVEGDEWKLFVFGADKKPLVESRWGETTENKEGDLAIHVRDAKDNKADLVFTLFNKYSASLAIGHK